MASAVSASMFKDSIDKDSVGIMSGERESIAVCGRCCLSTMHSPFRASLRFALFQILTSLLGKTKASAPFDKLKRHKRIKHVVKHAFLLIMTVTAIQYDADVHAAIKVKSHKEKIRDLRLSRMIRFVNDVITAFKSCLHSSPGCHDDNDDSSHQRSVKRHLTTVLVRTSSNTKAMKFLYLVAAALLVESSIAFTSTSVSSARRSAVTRFSSDADLDSSSRRELLSWGLSSLAFLASVEPLNAFDNNISDKYDDRPKRRGPQPKDLGVGVRKDMVGDEYTGLKPCGPAPNCFCSTDSIEDDPEHNIPAWTWPKSLDKTQAFQELEDAVKAYKPGQGNIDGGGFQIVKSEPGYLYAQFESLKNGYIDDVEFAYIDGKGENVIQVRSSSRIGYLDFGVNAKRLNYIAKTMQSKGWKAPGVDPATHQNYVLQNSG